MAQTEYRPQIDQMFEEVVSSPWESLRGGLVLGGEGLWNKVRRLVADSDADEEIRWHRRASTEADSRLFHSLLEQETDRRVAIWLRVRLGGDPMTEVAEGYGYRDGRGVHRVLQRLEGKAQHDRSLARHLKKLAEPVSRVDPSSKQVPSSMYWQLEYSAGIDVLHVFGRTYEQPAKYYYRRLLNGREWSTP